MMKKTTAVAAVIGCWLAMTACQQTVKNVEAKERTIQVTGSADMQVLPDEAELSMVIQSYGAGSLERIEKNLIAELATYGISAQAIQTTDIDDYWHYPSESLRHSKNLAVTIKDLTVIERLVSNIKVAGLSYIRISDLRHSQLQEYRKQVKADALKAAKMKAQYLLEAMDKSLGDVISIKEIQEQDQSPYRYYWWYRQPQQPATLSNVSAWSGQPDNDGNKLRTIPLRYEMEVVFEIQG